MAGKTAFLNYSKFTLLSQSKSHDWIKRPSSSSETKILFDSRKFLRSEDDSRSLSRESRAEKTEEG